MKKENLKRRDHPMMMNSIYKDQMACLLDIISKLTELDKTPFEFDKFIKEIFPLIYEAIPYLSSIAIIELSHDDSILVEGNYQIIDKPSIIYDWNEQKGLMFWNYENHPLNISSDPIKEAVCISRLCKVINDDTYFLIIARDEEKKPFLSHEVQAIRIYSKLLGWFIHYSLTDGVNRYMLIQQFKDASKKIIN